MQASKLYSDIEARTPGAARRKAIRKLDLRSKIFALLVSACRPGTHAHLAHPDPIAWKAREAFMECSVLVLDICTWSHVLNVQAGIVFFSEQHTELSFQERICLCLAREFTMFRGGALWGDMKVCIRHGMHALSAAPLGPSIQIACSA